ncbi:MAG: 1-acyl-sn-glycerol-3-phosphate acyltransferase [[Clostridium] fimetarium]|nr:1-acyl-sn-glycerol-3-phosphate acyltransferase [Alistipes timonensis]MCM1405801.1 1-acyl-sn-glycerol-3-phosphate acyltransferase [[Clostridium] fimetarium]
MNICKKLLSLAGWKVEVTVPDYPKMIYCVAPHTSNWDFPLCELAIRSVGRTAGFLMKASWFFFPLGSLFRALGGIPVERKNKRQSLTEYIVDKFRSEPRLKLAITPEGTRKGTRDWHTGFLRIAREAGVPICLAAIDYPSKTISATELFEPTGDMEADMLAVKKFYSAFTGKFADQCLTD